MTGMFKPLSGMLNQRKYIPIRCMQITIELSLADDHLDPIVSGLPAASQSETWQIQNVQVKCDLVTLDSGINEQYIKQLEKGNKLALNYKTFISQIQTITNQTDFSIQISRSSALLKPVLVALQKTRMTAFDFLHVIRFGTTFCLQISKYNQWRLRIYLR